MKTIVINASPRKKWNTAEIMQAAQKGAESAGAETEYFNLYDLVFKGCRSCLACKLKEKTKGKCYWNDDLTKVIDKILDADCLLIGSPIYFGQPTSEFRALVERLIFCIMSYDDGSSYFTGKVNVGIFYTMNAPLDFYEQSMKDSLSSTEFLFSFLIKSTFKLKTFLWSVFAIDIEQFSVILKSSKAYLHGEGNGTPLQCSCLENPRDRGA